MNYIAQYKDIAISEMNRYGIPASIKLAQAILESGNGNSTLAREANNHFGIKGKNNSTKIKSAYKGYSSVMDSYNDFVQLLKRRKKTAHLFDTYAHKNCKAWVDGIARSGYSQTKTWKNHVLGTISRYKLDQYDQI